MIKFLPFILIPVLILGSLWYWRNQSARQVQVATPKTQDQASVEVPKTLPDATKRPQVNSPKTPEPSAVPVVSDARFANLAAEITELKARISALEKATPAPQAVGAKYPLYIPLGAGGGPWTDQSWNTLNEYQAVINPDNYSGYVSMQLEANFRLTEAAGTGSVRLYNTTDASALSSQVDTTSTAFSTHTSGTFKLPGGSKTYTIQVKSTEGKQLFVQSARIKVNF